MDDYKKKIIQDESRTIAIDFDGVIHSFEHGYHDGTIYGTPIDGTHSALDSLAKKYKLVIYTAKAKKDRPLINGKTGTELIQEWLKKYELDKYVSEITAEKPRCICYIDDKAITFQNWDQALNDITKFTNKSI
jgi:hypothetical protein